MDHFVSSIDMYVYIYICRYEFVCYVTGTSHSHADTGHDDKTAADIDQDHSAFGYYGKTSIA